MAVGGAGGTLEHILSSQVIEGENESRVPLCEKRDIHNHLSNPLVTRSEDNSHGDGKDKRGNLI